MAATIDCKQIPRIQMDILSRTLLAAMERFYADPKNQKGFEEWLAAQNASKEPAPIAQAQT